MDRTQQTDAASAPDAPRPDTVSHTNTAGQPFDFDVTIVGAGPVGLALAGWLARRSATRALSVALIDAREPEDAVSDPRAIAVSHGSRMILEPLRWPADATAIQRIHVSQRGHFGRTLIDSLVKNDKEQGQKVALGDVMLDGLQHDIENTAREFQPGTSALFILARRMNFDKALPELKKLGGKVLKTSLSNADEQRLKSALEDLVAAPA